MGTVQRTGFDPALGSTVLVAAGAGPVTVMVPPVAVAVAATAKVHALLD